MCQLNQAMTKFSPFSESVNFICGSAPRLLGMAGTSDDGQMAGWWWRSHFLRNIFLSQVLRKSEKLGLESSCHENHVLLLWWLCLFNHHLEISKTTSMVPVVLWAFVNLIYGIGQIIVGCCSAWWPVSKALLSLRHLEWPVIADHRDHGDGIIVWWW